LSWDRTRDEDKGFGGSGCDHHHAALLDPTSQMLAPIASLRLIQTTRQRLPRYFAFPSATSMIRRVSR
jgi:hypothetical protein